VAAYAEMISARGSVMIMFPWRSDVYSYDRSG
jgi:hypothetical protein